MTRKVRAPEVAALVAVVVCLASSVWLALAGFWFAAPFPVVGAMTVASLYYFAVRQDGRIRPHGTQHRGRSRNTLHAAAAVLLLPMPAFVLAETEELAFVGVFFATCGMAAVAWLMFLLHAYHNDALTRNQRVIWIAVFFLLPLAAIPYWWSYVWQPPSDA